MEAPHYLLGDADEFCFHRNNNYQGMFEYEQLQKSQDTAFVKYGNE